MNCVMLGTNKRPSKSCAQRVAEKWIKWSAKERGRTGVIYYKLVCICALLCQRARESDFTPFHISGSHQEMLRAHYTLYLPSSNIDCENQAMIRIKLCIICVWASMGARVRASPKIIKRPHCHFYSWLNRRTHHEHIYRRSNHSLVGPFETITALPTQCTGK